MNPQATKSKTTALIANLIAGTQKHSSNGPLTLEGQSYTPQALIAALQSLEDALTKADMAKATWHGALAQVGQLQVTIQPLTAAYRNYLLLAYRNTPAVLADYGLAPRKKRTPLTTEKQAVAVAKRASTRAARRTMGSKQKTTVKGDVTGVVVTPVTEPKAVQLPAQPASPAPPQATPPNTPLAPSSH